MKLLTFENRTNPNAGLRLGLAWPGGPVIDLPLAASALGLRSLPTKMLDYLEGGAMTRDTVEEIISRADEFGGSVTDFVLPPERVSVRSPLPFPRSVRRFHAFEQHFRALREWLGLPMPQGWYRTPTFEFCNHLSVRGPNETIPQPRSGTALDFELGIACVISRAGVNIAEAEAKAYIAGLTIAAGWVLRDLQRVEASLGLGPSKSQDFAISLGPYIVTLDELKGAEEGNRHKLGGTVSVNGREFTCASLSSAHWTFPQMVEVASRDAPLYPGDILATGAVPGGSLLTSRRDGPWLQPGDVVRFQVESLGTLTNNVE